MIKYFRVHSYTIFIYLSKFIFLLIIPIFQVLIFKSDGFANIIRQIGLNLFFTVLIVLYAVFRYRCEGYILYGKKLFIKKGLFFQKQKKLPVDNIDSITIQKSFFPGLLFNVCRFFADVPSLTKTMDTAVYIHYGKALRIVNKLTGNIKRKCIYKAKTVKIIFMAAIWSNSATGFIILMPFIANLEKILGNKITSDVYNSLSLTEYLIYAGLPPAAAGLTNIILLCWIFALLVQLNRYLRFSVDKGGNLLFIKRGFLNRITFITAYESINALTVKQNIFMMLGKLYGTYIHTISTEKTKGDKSLLISPEKRDTLKRTVNKILPDFLLDFKKDITPSKSSIRSFLYLPFFLLSLDVIPVAIMFYTDKFDSIIYLFLALSLPLILLWFSFRIIAYYKTELSFNQQSIKAVTFNRLTINENYIPLKKVQKITVRQSLFQKVSGNCNVYIYTFSENMKHYTVRHLPIKSVEKLLSIKADK